MKDDIKTLILPSNVTSLSIYRIDKKFRDSELDLLNLDIQIKKTKASLDELELERLRIKRQLKLLENKIVDSALKDL